METIGGVVDNEELHCVENVACRPKKRKYFQSTVNMISDKPKRPIRVGHVLTSLCEGGLERFSLSLATNLPKDRFEIKVYALLRENTWLEEFRSKGISVEVFDADNRPRLRSLPRNLKALLQLSRAMSRDGI
ncbi:MAG: hypothetical protein AAB214_10755, partial [Fibrobacterota bacterium]